MVRTSRYKYVVYAAGQNREQFFDLERDRGETANLMADPRLKDEIEGRRELLARWMRDTKDDFSTVPAADMGNVRRRKSK